MNDKLTAATIVMLLTLAVSAIFDVLPPESREAHKPTWQPPAIPSCDKPLWDRIREGCK